MMAAVHYVASGAGLTKFPAAWFLLDRVYKTDRCYKFNSKWSDNTQYRVTWLTQKVTS